MKTTKKLLALIMALMMMAASLALAEEATAPAATEETPVAAEETQAADTAATSNAQKLDMAYTLALNAITAEDYVTARKYLNIAFVYCDKTDNPTIYADLLLKQACIDVIEGDNAIALLALDAALTVAPDLADAYLVRTQIYTADAQFTKAAENLEKYIELTKDEAMYETVAQLHEANGDLAAAQAAYDKYVTTAGAENPDAAFQAGLYRMDNGQFEQAVEAFAPYTENETYAAAAYYNIGLCKMNMGDFAGAIEAFNTCEAKEGSYSGMYYNRGFCYLMSEDWVNGADDFARSIASEPYVADAKYNLGVCNMQQGEFEAAVAAFTDLIDSTAAGEGEEAIQLNPAVYYFRAACNAAMGKLEEAIADYTFCIDSGYDLANTYYQRAKVYEAMGDTEKQNADLQAALQNAN